MLQPTTAAAATPTSATTGYDNTHAQQARHTGNTHREHLAGALAVAGCDDGCVHVVEAAALEEAVRGVGQRVADARDRADGVGPRERGVGRAGGSEGRGSWVLSVCFGGDGDTKLVGGFGRAASALDTSNTGPHHTTSRPHKKNNAARAPGAQVRLLAQELERLLLLGHGVGGRVARAHVQHLGEGPRAAPRWVCGRRKVHR